jgi:hypothetical protein
MNNISEYKDYEMLIKLKINKPEKKIFLNGDDPFDEQNWVAGSELIFDIQEDDVREGVYKVKDNLKEYKELLMLAGASVMKPPPPPSPNPIFDQKEKLVISLQNKLEVQDNKHHDVIFIIDKEKIGANKYVLSGIYDAFTFVQSI